MRERNIQRKKGKDGESWSNSKCKDIKIDKEVSKELKKLKEKYKLFIVSSNIEKNIKSYLGGDGILDLFDRILGEETHKSKHDKILRIFKEYKLNKDNTIFVTDTTGDIKENKRYWTKSNCC